MKHVRSLFLLSVGSLALFFCAVAAHADTIPTLTATSVTYSAQSGLKSWAIAGNSFSLGGAGGALGVLGTETVGQSFSGGAIDTSFTATVGPGGFTTGSVTLDGVTHTVQLLDIPSFVFPSGLVYQHSVTGTAGDGSLEIVATVPTLIALNNSSPGRLQETFCNPPANSQACFGNVLANVSIDVSGLTTLLGVQHPGDNFDTITSISFTATPEPVSSALATVGLAAMLVLGAYRKKTVQ